MKVNIQATHDSKLELDLEASETALSVKQKISSHERMEGVPVEAIRLIYSGKILKDDEIISAVGIREGNTIHMVKSQKKAQPAPGIPATTPSTASTATPSAIPSTSAAPVPPAMPFDGGMPFGMMPDMQDPALLAGADAMMADPAIRDQMVEMMTANPELLRAAMQMNPGFNQMPPQMQEMMLNPAMLRLMLETSAAMRTGGAGAAPTAPQMATPGSSALPPNIMNLIGALGGAQGMPPAPAPVSNEPPEIRFASQLQQLNEMGFWDKDENIRALLLTNGNVNAAIERLLSG